MWRLRPVRFAWRNNFVNFSMNKYTYLGRKFSFPYEAKEICL